MASVQNQIRQLIGFAKSAPRGLKILAIVAAIDVVVILLAALLLEGEVDDSAAELAALQGQLTAQEQTIEVTRKEIGRLPELRRLYDAAISSGVLADQDRLKLVSMAQELANQHRLLDLHYRLAPEQLTQLPGSQYRLVSTEVELTDGAILDADVFGFWDELLAKSPAHYQVTKFQLQRIGRDIKPTVAGILSGHPMPLVKAELDFKWISLRPPADSPAAAAGSARTAQAAPSAGQPATAEAAK